MERMTEIFRNNKHLIEHRKYMFSETMPKFRKKKRRGRPRKSVEVKNEKVTQLEEMDTQLLFPKNLSKSCNMKKNKLKDEVVPLVRTTSPISKKIKKVSPKGTTNKDELDKEDQTNINIRLCRVSKSANSYAVVKKRIISDQDDTQSSVITTTVVSPKNNDDDKVGVQSPSTECQTTLNGKVDNITVIDVKEEPKDHRHTKSSESVNADRELCKPNDASNPVVVEKECVSVPQDCLSPLSCMRLGVPATAKSLSLFTPKKRECEKYDCLAVMMKPLTAKEPRAENQLKSAVVAKNLKQNKKKLHFMGQLNLLQALPSHTSPSIGTYTLSPQNDNHVNSKFKKNGCYYGTGKIPCPDLGNGWFFEQIVRQQGKSAGNFDVYYYSPKNVRIRSKLNLSKHVPESIAMDNFDYNAGRFLKSGEHLHKKDALISTKLFRSSLSSLKSSPIVYKDQQDLSKFDSKTATKPGLKQRNLISEFNRKRKLPTNNHVFKKRKLFKGNQPFPSEDFNSKPMSAFEIFKSDMMRICPFHVDCVKYPELLRLTAWKNLGLEKRQWYEARERNILKFSSSQINISTGSIIPKPKAKASQPVKGIIYEEEWNKRKTRCRVCGPCLRPNCGQCYNCRDMQQFGGLGRKKQSCLNRRCVRLKVRVCAKRKVNVSQPRFQPNKDIEILHDLSLCPPRAPTPEKIRALHSGPLPTLSTENVNMQQNFLVRPHDPLNPLPMPLQHHTALPGAQLIQKCSSVLPTDMNSVWDDPFMRHFVKSPESIVASHPTLALMINSTPSCTAITRRTSLNHTLNALNDKPVNDMNHVWEDPSMRQFLKPTDTNSPSLQVNPTHNNANITSLSLCHQQEPVESSVSATKPVESRLSPVAIKHQVSPIFKRKNPSPHLRKSPQGLGSALHASYLMPSEPQQHASKVEPENVDIKEKEQLVQSGYQKMVNFYETPVPLASYAYTPPYPRRLLVWPNQPNNEKS